MIRNLSPALRLALFYLFFSGAWILLSDIVVERLVGDNITLLRTIQSVKGLSFVVICSLLLYYVSRKFYNNLRQSLQKTEELLGRYKALGEATKEGIADHDLINDTAVINEQMKFFTRESSNTVDAYAARHNKRIHPDDLQRIKKNLADTLATSSQIWQADYRYFMFDGRYHDVIERGIIIRKKDGRPVRMISAIQDVTELRNMKTVFYEQQLKHKLSLGQSIIQAQEEERNRWAQELHDNVCQLLTVVKLYLDQVANESAFGSPLLGKAQDMTAKALNDIRQLSASIKPPEFSITTLAQSIEELLANIKRVKNFQFKLDFRGLKEEELNDEQKLMIYRVVQEQLNNIIKYAEASLISILVKIEGQDVQMEITDNGKGFDTERVITGIGLKNIRSRLQVYAGNLVVESSPGHGCTVAASFSIDRQSY